MCNGRKANGIVFYIQCQCALSLKLLGSPYRQAACFINCGKAHRRDADAVDGLSDKDTREAVVAHFNRAVGRSVFHAPAAGIGTGDGTVFVQCDVGRLHNGNFVCRGGIIADVIGIDNDLIGSCDVRSRNAFTVIKLLIRYGVFIRRSDDPAVFILEQFMNTQFV